MLGISLGSHAAAGRTIEVGANEKSGASIAPNALAATRDGGTLFIACGRTNQLLCFDTNHNKLMTSIALPPSPSGLILSADETQLFVTCSAPHSQVCIVDLKSLKVVGRVPVGHTAMAPVISPDGARLFICNRFDNDISVIDVARRKEVRRIAVRHEPVAASVTPDGRFLLVANHLSSSPSDANCVAAVVSVVDLPVGRVVKEIQLPNGSESLRDIRVSPDGKYAVLTHIVGNFGQATTQVAAGWINANALTIVDVARMEIRATLLLDHPNKGAANPWGVAWSGDGGRLVVAHAGTHEVSVIDFPLLLAHLPEKPGVRPAATPGKRADDVVTFLPKEEVLLPFIGSARQRIKLPEGDLGPRAVAFTGNKVYTANYFSDTLSVIDLRTPEPSVESIRLGPKREMDLVRKGEFYFHDATICFQGWQSCASCHPGDARADALNWDLRNDGVSNPKNTKSLLFAHRTPPSMSLGIRPNAETAVRAGLKYIHFSDQPEEVAVAIDEYLKSLRPVPSPYLVKGKMSKSAKRGAKVYQQAGCADCHPPGLLTDLRQYDVGTGRVSDRPTDTFDTPTLTEVWRTAPYLHDGSAVTIRDVLTTRNPNDRHGRTSSLSETELNDLCEYVLSL